jgi:hypothetical protein
LTPCQDDISPDELKTGRMIPAGWPSADNIVIKANMFDYRDVLAPDIYIPWYQRPHAPFAPGNARDRNAARGKLASSERFCLEAAKHGGQAWIDTNVKVWHVHESGGTNNGPLARLWPDLEVPYEELTWPESG